VRQFPLFVDWGGGSVAAVVTAPDADPKGIVISLAGTGRHNVIGSTMCMHLARRVVEHGLASVRLDYAGIGDSPGLVSTWTPSDVDAAARQARAVLAATMDGLDVGRFVGVGTCYGSRVALALAAEPSCVGLVCLAPPILEFGGLARVGRQVGDGTILSYVKSNAALRRVLRPLRSTLRARKPAAAVAGAFAHLDRTRIAFLYGTPAFDDHYSRGAREAVDASLERLPSELRENFELHTLPWGPLSTFDILSPEDQAAVLDVVVPLVCRGFDDALVAPVPRATVVA
jgi:pimeloyl-ACP methyl ester carboxylesterase